MNNIINFTTDVLHTWSPIQLRAYVYYHITESIEHVYKMMTTFITRSAAKPLSQKQHAVLVAMIAKGSQLGVFMNTYMYRRQIKDILRGDLFKFLLTIVNTLTRLLLSMAADIQCYSTQLMLHTGLPKVHAADNGRMIADTGTVT